jgi:hypothetical protein
MKNNDNKDNMDKKKSSSNLHEIYFNLKKGKPLDKIIPNNLPNIRQMNEVFNYKNFSTIKERDYSPPYEPFRIFPIWPNEDEVEVNKLKFKKINLK